MATPNALSPEQSPEQLRDDPPDPDAEQKRVQETAPARDEATSLAPVGIVVTEPATAERDTESAARCTEAELHTMLGLGLMGAVMPLSVRVRGWIVTGAIGVITTLLCLIGLNHPKTLMSDGIHYTKDVCSLWHPGYEAAWDDKAGSADAASAIEDFFRPIDNAAYVVRPQLGKWPISTGMEIFGPESPFGRRFMPAVAGILTVMPPACLTMCPTLLPLLAGLAGLLLTINGVALTESRIGLLDMFISFLTTLSLYCLARNREWSRVRLARRMTGTKPGAYAPHATIRPWLPAAGVALELICSIEWSGLYLVAVCGIAVVIWDTLALRRVRAWAWSLEGTVAQGMSDFVQVIPIVIMVHVDCWWSQFTYLGTFKHGRTAEQIRRGLSALASQLSGYVDNSMFERINDFTVYHQQMYELHVGLDAPHTYQSKPSGWLLQTRPTSFFQEDKARIPQAYGGGDCTQVITSIGNIVIWRSVMVALVVVVTIGAKNRDQRVWVPPISYLGLYVPWFQYRDHTIFTFYTVAFAPCATLVLVLALGITPGLLPPLSGPTSADMQMGALLRRWVGPGIRPWHGMGIRFPGFSSRFACTLVWTPPVERVSPGIYRVNPALVDDDDLEPGAPLTDPRTDAALARSYDELTGYPAPSVSWGATKSAWSDSRVSWLASRRSPWASLAKWTMVLTWQIRTKGIDPTIVVIFLACVATVFWWPIQTGQTVSRSFWIPYIFLSSQI